MQNATAVLKSTQNAMDKLSITSGLLLLSAKHVNWIHNCLCCSSVTQCQSYKSGDMLATPGSKLVVVTYRWLIN